MRLALGTVQFGLKYGISNSRGKVRLDEVDKILSFSKDSGIVVLDTAQGYGDSEKILGQFDLTPFCVVSKIMGNGTAEESLHKLRIQKLYGLLFHREEEINHHSWQRFEHYKAQGLVEKIGVSVYNPLKLLEILEHFPIDIVQLPLNLLDQRFVPLLSVLKQRNVEVHTRSAFLQGLLLMDPSITSEPKDPDSITPKEIDHTSHAIDHYFDPIRPVLSKIPEPRMAYALQFVKQQQGIDHTVVGVTSCSELKEIVYYNNIAYPSVADAEFRVDDERFINPALWKL